ncbi:uncharacterized protein LOC143895545 [Temnothorax americanus]|uniref:uncharacterized protein LOC143895545 n=1 Tax=Temnothorax americanus TaxID=1964332 RepID=UPI0040684399
MKITVVFMVLAVVVCATAQESGQVPWSVDPNVLPGIPGSPIAYNRPKTLLESIPFPISLRQLMDPLGLFHSTEQRSISWPSWPWLRSLGKSKATSGKIPTTSGSAWTSAPGIPESAWTSAPRLPESTWVANANDEIPTGIPTGIPTAVPPQYVLPG